MLVELEKLEKELGKLNPEERRLRERLINGLVRMASADVSSERLRALGEALDDAPTEAEGGGPLRGAALEAARMRNLVRVLEDRARLREESLRSGAVERALGVGRERLRQMRERGQILGLVQGERRPTLYPYWQFCGDGRVVDGMEEVLAASRDAGMDPGTLHFFMTEPDERLGGARPVEALREGRVEEVARLLRSTGLGPF